MTPVVELVGASRSFGQGHTAVVALHPTDLRVGAAEFLAVMGPSGSGKTTLLSLVGGLDKPSAGRVIVEGKDVGALRPRELAILRRRTVGYVFQDLNLLRGLTARENVSLPLELDGRSAAVERQHLTDCYPRPNPAKDNLTAVCRDYQVPCDSSGNGTNVPCE